MEVVDAINLGATTLSYHLARPYHWHSPFTFVPVGRCRLTSNRTHMTHYHQQRWPHIPQPTSLSALRSSMSQIGCSLATRLFLTSRAQPLLDHPLQAGYNHNKRPLCRQSQMGLPSSQRKSTKSKARRNRVIFETSTFDRKKLIL
jgi:hypothetical protein